ncbi:MAG: hypothetical protein AAF330_00555 [Pseudomonadota bacterium]
MRARLALALSAPALALTLSGCLDAVPGLGGVPDSGIGSPSYRDYLRAQEARNAVLEGRPPEPEVAVPLDLAIPAPPEVTALPPVSTEAGDTALLPVPLPDTSTISSEQDFEAVSGQRSIESDAQRIAANRAQYRVVEPSSLPSRAVGEGPNIVAYAIATNNPVGAQIYTRRGFNVADRNERNCAQFASPDLAQEAFLANGGPQRDRQALDPDGDGFACGWDPSPFRLITN